MPKSIRDLLSSADIETGLRALIAAAAGDAEKADDARVLLARYLRAEREHSLGLREAQKFDAAWAQITRAALKLVGELGLNDSAAISASNRAPSAEVASGEVFISYKWGGESEKVANLVERALLDDGFQVMRDKHVLDFKADIEQFMARLSTGNAVVCLLSHEYLRSTNCMRELVRLVDHPDPDSRLFPIVFPDAGIYQPATRLEHVKYWQDERDRLNASLRELPSQEGLVTARSEIDLYANIAGSIDPLIGWLQRKNAMDLNTHVTTSFEALRQALQQRLRGRG